MINTESVVCHVILFLEKRLWMLRWIRKLNRFTSWLKHSTGYVSKMKSHGIAINVVHCRECFSCKHKLTLKASRVWYEIIHTCCCIRQVYKTFQSSFAIDAGLEMKPQLLPFPSQKSFQYAHSRNNVKDEAFKNPIA